MMKWWWWWWWWWWWFNDDDGTGSDVDVDVDDDDDDDDDDDSFMQLLKYIGQFLLFHVNSVVNLPLWSCRASTPQEDMLAARDLSQPPRSTLSKGSTRRGPGLKTVGPRWVNDESRWVMPLSWWLFGIVLARSSIFPRPWPQNSLGAVTLMAIGHFAIAGQSYLKSAMDRWGPLKSVNLKNLLNTNHMLATSLDHSERWWHILFVFVCHMSEFPTCQVRVVRFYVSLFSSFFFFFFSFFSFVVLLN